MKRVLTIQDISCIGKCSLTVAVPILSILGLEAAIVPTAVLSTHTQFSDIAFRDLTDEMEPIMAHWVREGFEFETVYSGYLGSIRQVEIVKKYFDTFAPQEGEYHSRPKRIVDPVMADNGKLYAGFDEPFVHEMRSLCGIADVILPNMSEAALLLGTPYPGEDADEEDVRKLLRGLAELGCRTAVITGVTLDNGTFGFIGFNRETGEYYRYGNKKIPFKSHGTGDIFASTFTGALTLGRSTYDALCVAADFTSACIEDTYADANRVNYAVNFEYELPYLLERIRVTDPV